MFRKRSAAIALLICAIWSPAFAQVANGLSAGQISEIERAISSEMSRQNIPALSVAIGSGGQLRFANGFGLADLENFVPAKASTIYRLASISKSVTAIAVMQLVERGQIDLDAPVQKYVPSFPRKQWPLTIRDLLRHQGGIRHYRDDSEMNSTRHYTELGDALRIFREDLLVFEPGTRYLYSTFGYNLLGAAVEGASGTKFTEYIRRNIFEPAGMRTIRPDDAFEIIPNRARGYRKVLGGGIRNCALADTSNKIPGGGLCSNAEDLVALASHLWAGTLLKKETLALMFTRQTTRDGKPTPYGLGWQIGDAPGRPWVGHGGAQTGTRTLLWMSPTGDFTVALMANLEGVQLEPLARKIADIVLE